MTTDTVAVTFRFPCVLAPRANHISCLGTFNELESHYSPPDQNAGRLLGYQGAFASARTVYCSDVDGASWFDPNDEGRIPNAWGSEYSVRDVCAGRQYLFPMHG